jgi:FSR family fosmidomycin resistance protein-like MFS transporter
MPAIRDDLALSYAEIGVLLAVPNVVSGIVEPFVGVLGDVWRRAVVIGVGGCGYAIALALVAVSGSFGLLLAAFVLMYPAVGAFVGLSQASLMDLEPDGRERNMVRWTIAGAIGALAGPVVVAVTLDAGAGWRAVFAGLAAVALGLVLVGGGNGAAPTEATTRPCLGDALAAVRRWTLVRWLLLLEASDLVLDVLRGFLAVYLVDEGGLGRSAAALALGGVFGADLLGNALLLRLLRWVPGPWYLRASAGAAAPLFAAFLVVPSGAGKVVLVVALGLTTAGWYPLLKAGLYSALPGLSGTAMALSSVTGPIAALPPLAVGALASAAGLPNALWLLLLGPLVLAALAPRRSDSVGTDAAG